MKFPESWLREHVTVTASREELAARLTAIGLEVENLENIGGALEGVVVAEILSCARHPEADRLPPHERCLKRRDGSCVSSL
jgi:phenylalanyl-tRNA synthetase beta chain